MQNNFSNQLSSKELFLSNFKNVPFESHFKIAGLLSTGTNLKPDGLVKGTKALSKIRRVYCKTICFLFWFISLRQLILMFVGQKDRFTQVILGDLTGYWNNYRHYFLIPSFFLSLQNAAICTWFYTKEKNLQWGVPFFSIRQLQIRNDQSFMYYHYHERLKLINFALSVTWLITLSSTAIFGFKTFETAYTHFDNLTFYCFLPWMLIQIIWFFYLVFISYIVVFYFYLVCKLISERFKRIGDQISDIAEYSEACDLYQKDLNSLYTDHCRTCELVDESNLFWEKYICFVTLILLPCSCYCLYNLFFGDETYMLQITTWTIFLHTIVIVVIICTSASKVNQEAHVPYSPLHTILLKLSLNNTQSNMEVFLSRVRGQPIGFSCLDLFYVTKSSVANAFVSVVAYFLICADFSRSMTINRYNTQNSNNNNTLTTLMNTVTTILF